LALAAAVALLLPAATTAAIGLACLACEFEQAVDVLLYFTRALRRTLEQLIHARQAGIAQLLRVACSCIVEQSIDLLETTLDLAKELDHLFLAIALLLRKAARWFLLLCPNRADAPTRQEEKRSAGHEM
jgi:hypothetical protein